MSDHDQTHDDTPREPQHQPQPRGLTRRAVLGGIAASSALAACGPMLTAPDPVPVNLPTDVQPCTTPPETPPTFLAKPDGLPFYAPQPPVYPYYGSSTREGVTGKALCISRALEAYIRAWFAGRVPSDIPGAFLPQGRNRTDLTNFRLVRPQDINPERQWIVRAAEPLDPARGVRSSFPDPNVTYLVMQMYAPFGTRVEIEGDFPHARFFDIQATPPFQPEYYRYNAFGTPEVPIVDVDINPEPGSTNPFQVGADRNAVNRRYRVNLELQIGDAVALNPAMRPPNYRAPGNTRVAGGLLWRGPWGATTNGGDGFGVWEEGEIWIRYYRPDFAKGALGGVGLPRVTYVLSTGERFYIEVNDDSLDTRANRLVIPEATPPQAPRPQEGPLEGWNKEYGIFRAPIEGFAINTGSTTPEAKRYVRDLDKGVAGRGTDAPQQMRFEPSATSATYINYFLRGMSCEAGKVVILTGTLPTTPRTSSGEAVMTAAQARYWSLVGYSVPTGGELIRGIFDPVFGQSVTGAPIQAIYDEEIVTDALRRYVIVLSRPADRPSNATPGNGVTWADWGPRGDVSWTLRWLSVAPEWSFDRTPDEVRLPPSLANWAEATYDKRLIGLNNRDGYLKEFQPIIGYLTRAQFEALGANVTPDRVPVWR
jgi:hypothetical protein